MSDDKSPDFGPLMPILPVPVDGNIEDPSPLVPQDWWNYPVTGLREALFQLLAGRECDCEKCREDI